jgi:RND family efflux transporter MFP subunit
MARGVVILALAALAASLAAPPGRATDPLRAATPTEHSGERRVVIAGTGTVVAHKTSNLGPLVEGRIEKIHVNVGDRVEVDAPLFETRGETFKLKVDEAKAAAAVAEARLTQAELAWARIEPLSDRGVTSKANRDVALSAAQVARAEIEAARARLRQAEQDLADTVVRAPFRAAVTARYVDEGVFLTNRVPGGTGSSVIQLQKIDVLVAIVRVPSRDLPLLSVGAPATLKVDGYDQPIEAKVSVINDMVDPATRTVEIRIAFENLNYAIKAGVFVQAEIRPSRKSALPPSKVPVITSDGR